MNSTCLETSDCPHFHEFATFVKTCEKIWHSLSTDEKIGKYNILVYIVSKCKYIQSYKSVLDMCEKKRLECEKFGVHLQKPKTLDTIISQDPHDTAKVDTIIIKDLDDIATRFETTIDDDAKTKIIDWMKAQVKEIKKIGIDIYISNIDSEPLFFGMGEEGQSLQQMVYQILEEHKNPESPISMYTPFSFELTEHGIVSLFAEIFSRSCHHAQ